MKRLMSTVSIAAFLSVPAMGSWEYVVEDAKEDISRQSENKTIHKNLLVEYTLEKSRVELRLKSLLANPSVDEKVKNEVTLVVKPDLQNLRANFSSQSTVDKIVYLEIQIKKLQDHLSQFDNLDDMYKNKDKDKDKNKATNTPSSFSAATNDREQQPEVTPEPKLTRLQEIKENLGIIGITAVSNAVFPLGAEQDGVSSTTSGTGTVTFSLQDGTTLAEQMDIIRQTIYENRASGRTQNRCTGHDDYMSRKGFKKVKIIHRHQWYNHNIEDQYKKIIYSLSEDQSIQFVGEDSLFKQDVKFVVTGNSSGYHEHAQGVFCTEQNKVL